VRFFNQLRDQISMSLENFPVLLIFGENGSFMQLIFFTHNFISLLIFTFIQGSLYFSRDVLCGINWTIPVVNEVLNIFQFSSTDLSSGLDAKNVDDDSDMNFLSPGRLALL